MHIRKSRSEWNSARAARRDGAPAETPVAPGPRGASRAPSTRGASRAPSSPRGAWKAVAGAIALCCAFASALAQDPGASPAPAPAPRPDEASRAPLAAPLGADVRESRVLGILAWRRAVWTGDDASYARAASELARVHAETRDADPGAVFLLGLSLARLNRRAESEAAFADAFRGSPPTPGMLLAKAVAFTADKPGHVAQPRTKEAIAALDAFLLELPNIRRMSQFAAELEYLGHVERGLRLFADDGHEGAFVDLQRAAEIARAAGRPPAPEVARMLIQARKDRQEFGVAGQIADAALRRSPGDPDNHFVKAIVAAEAKQMDEARRSHERALRLRPGYFESHAKIAFIAWEGFDLDSMRRHLEAYDALLRRQWETAPQTRTPTAAANLRGGWGSYWMRRGDVAAESGDIEGARAHWTRARTEFLESYKEAPGCVRAMTSLVQVLSLLQAPQEEIDLWTRRTEEMRQPKPGSVKGYRDTFC